MKRFVGVGVLLALACIALALGTYTKVFVTQYKVDASSALGKAGCAACHMSKTDLKLNPYGKDLAEQLKKEGTKKLTPAILAKVEALDSDKDGVKNIDEIKKGELPGVK
ncbi:MAG: hypothetical protein M9921_02760 [Fimbriimonadaceae bacterium]|nr:hypothetical protein [Chthonomonadaceae bacterium]MCO5295754.1 hypothetical protein [Fimbriimonadaceae bacterium]